MKARVFFIVAFLILLSSPVFASNIVLIEMPAPPIDMKLVNKIWHMVQDLTGRTDFPPPPIVIDWEVPMPFGGGFQFPTASSPNTRVQISIAPRTIDINEKTTPGWTYYAIGHELLHYQYYKMGYPIDENDLSHKSHHCLPEFQKNVEKIVDFLQTVFYSPDLKWRPLGRLMVQCTRESGKKS